MTLPCEIMYNKNIKSFGSIIANTTLKNLVVISKPCKELNYSSFELILLSFNMPITPQML